MQSMDIFDAGQQKYFVTTQDTSALCTNILDDV